MTQDQINDVAIAARLAAIGQAQKSGDRVAFAIVVCGLDVGAGMSVQTNVKDAKPEQVVRILQNGIAALQNRGGGLILLSALLLWLCAMAIASCGSVTEGANDARDVRGADAEVSGRGGAAAAAGGAGGGLPDGMAGGGAAGDLGAAGATGGAAAGGGAGVGPDGGLTGAAGAGDVDAGPTCTPRVAGAICYQCPAPAPTCSVANRGAWACCDQGGRVSCDLTWCRQ